MNQSKENIQKKPKVALMSFHNGFNYGAALQAYALQKAVEDIGCECEYIDYVNTHRRELYDMGCRFKNAVVNKNVKSAVVAVCGAPFMHQRGAKFKNFYSTYVRKTERTYTSTEDAKALNGHYDKFVIGSDQVWNYGNNGADWAYLLDFVDDDCRKISYSSSFGLSFIPEEHVDAYKKNLSSFSRLAVRETKGVELVKELTGRQAHLVLDPVFLLPAEDWKNVASKQDSKPYIFAYTDTKSELQDFIDHCRESDEYDYHILSASVSVSDFLDKKKKIRISMSPEDFLSEILNAEFIVTDSFHCLAFALIFHKPFCVILSGNRGKDERLLNLLNISGLENHIFDPQEGQIQLNEKIDFENVDKCISPYIDYSLQYLTNALFDLPDIDQKESHDSDEGTVYMCEDDRCTGCSACEQICVVGAVQMKADAYGFLKPIRDTDKCVNCGRCHKVCQVYNRHSKIDLDMQQIWGIKNNEFVRKMSTSGGAFSMITDFILSQNGYIAAAEFDTNTFTLAHQIASTKEARDRMHGTYYVQSALGDVYSKIKELLHTDKPVLFIGTPCQVYGLKLFLNIIPENLYLCDIICHGVPSPMVFDEFITFLKKKGVLTAFKFRDKSIGWRGYTDSAVINGKYISNKLWLQSYDSMFSHNIINRMSCSDCQFCNYDRVGDITIGDFWGVEKTAPDFEDKLGVSLVLCNTEKGNEIVAASNVEKIPVSRSECKQNSLNAPTVAARTRNQAFKCLKTEGYEEMIKKYGECNLVGKCKNIIRKIK